MARMSIDDKFNRDPRVILLGALTGWSRREVMGCLLDIFSLCYDRVSEFLPERLITVVANMDGLQCAGFVDKMIEAQLATRHKSGMIRVAGAQERITYLRRQSALGRQGGLKSSESRRKKVKGRLSEPQGSLGLSLEAPKVDPQGPANPPDPVPDPVPASPPASASAVASAPVLALVPDPRETETGRIVRDVHAEHVKRFNQLRAELKLGERVPAMQPIGDPAERALLELARDHVTLVGFRERAMHALDVREAQARAREALDYFGTSVWNRVAFGKAQSMSVADVSTSVAAERQAPQRSSHFDAANRFFDELDTDDDAGGSKS